MKPLTSIAQVTITVDHTAGVSLFEKYISLKLNEYPIQPRSDITYIGL
ncbi:hypothetical protein [Candidatus Albibeggiatoa sp. nov. NOAA]